jgi:hypothetical protein
MLNLVVNKVTTGLNTVKVGFRKVRYEDTRPDVPPLILVLLRIQVFWDIGPSLFWDVTQSYMVVSYRGFEITYR